jgi:hypothetical protein
MSFPTVTRVEMTTSHEGARPGVSIDRGGRQEMAVLHLTRNSGGIVHPPARTRAEASAIRITGNVVLPAKSLAEIRANWSFHLTQLFLSLADNANYAGKTPSDGTMSFDFASGLGDSGFMVDSDPDNEQKIPYAETSTSMTSAGWMVGMWLVSVGLDDHPNSRYPLTFPNYAAGNKSNYLYEVNRQFEVMTALVVRDMKTFVYQILAYVFWGARCSAKFRWYPDLSVTSRIEGSEFQVSKVFLGAPTHGSFGAMITNPPTDPEQMYNRAVKRVLDAAYRSLGDSRNVRAVKEAIVGTFPPHHFSP